MLKIPHIEEASIRFRVIKYFIAMFCGLYLFQGLVTISVSIWLVTQGVYSCSFAGSYYTANYLLLTAALGTTFIGALGMYKTLARRNEHFFRIFMFCLVGILAFELMSAIVAHVQDTLLSIKLPTDMKATFSNFYTDFHAEKCVNSLQNEFHCCGVKNFTELFNINSGNVSLFPDSCLCDSKANCFFYRGPTSNISVYSKPCYAEVSARLTSYLTVFRVIGPVLAAIQVMFLLLVMYFISRFQSNTVIGAYVVSKNGLRQKSEGSSSISQLSVAGTDMELGTSVGEESEHM